MKTIDAVGGIATSAGTCRCCTRPHHVTIPFEFESDRAYVDALDHEIVRSLDVSQGSAHMRIVVDGSAIAAYVNDVALSTRGYSLVDGCWALHVVRGDARFTQARTGRLRDRSVPG